MHENLQLLPFEGYQHARLTHYLFRYPAKFHPPIARKLVEDFSAEGELILDPFCGSGTLLVEALLADRRPIGLDIDPVAVFVSRVKTLSISLRSLRRTTSTLLKTMEELERPDSNYDRLKFEDISVSQFKKEISARKLILPEIPNFFHWFRRYVAVDLATIRAQIDLVSMPNTHRLLLQLVFASIIRGASNADPVPVSGLEVTAHMRRLENKGRHINPFFLFRRNLSRALRDWEEYQARRRKSRSTVLVRQVDAMSIRKHLRRKVDAVVTSPPYHQAVDYYRRHTLEMFWLRLVKSRNDRLRLRSRYIGRYNVAKSDPIAKNGALRTPIAREWDAKLRDRSEPRARDFRHYICAMSRCIDGVASALKPRGKAVFVLGKNTTSGIEIPSTEIFDEIASSRLELNEQYWYPVRNRYMTYARRNGANIDKEFVLVYEKKKDN